MTVVIRNKRTHKKIWLIFFCNNSVITSRTFFPFIPTTFVCVYDVCLCVCVEMDKVNEWLNQENIILFYLFKCNEE